MKEILNVVEQKLSHLMTNLIITGSLLLILAVLVAFSSFMAQLLIAVAVLVISYAFFYWAAKIYSIKKLLKK